MAPMDEKPKYLRWHPAEPDSGSLRGECLEALNQRTLDVLHERALDEDRDATNTPGRG